MDFEFLKKAQRETILEIKYSFFNLFFILGQLEIDQLKTSLKSLTNRMYHVKTTTTTTKTRFKNRGQSTVFFSFSKAQSDGFLSCFCCCL